MNGGHISIHRKLMDAFFYKDSRYLHLWLHLLLKANWKDNEILFQGKVLTIKRGQFLTSRKQLAKETGINESKVERILKTFKIEQQIEQQNMFTSRLITIVRYEEYQIVNSKVNSERTASEQQMNTTNKDKKDKKKNTTISYNEFTGEFEDIPEELITKWKSLYIYIDVEQKIKELASWREANPKKKYSNNHKFLVNNMSRENNKEKIERGDNITKEEAKDKHDKSLELRRD